MRVGDLIVLEVEDDYKGFVADLGFDDTGAPWVEIWFLDGDKGFFNIDDIDWRVISESR
jgi:hypothetical protein